ncbi:flagellar biosynthetic protein FliP [Murinocardiopsis flavida]|uniref:Flagellar biosynthetic protein FliP n=1 Tax=Murinocardiopsis flavida TaxID=645275 RepID=A0A2P8DS87_9ACTN|nr:hypothetical protein [Murinocardiopsis flavida]PSL00077.1 flagellar biosynthetic protein FliP [Murinocardiopsis flavida]
MEARNEDRKPPTDAATHSRGGGVPSAPSDPGARAGGSGTWHFIRHFLEMLVAMVVGMLVLGAAVDGVLTLAGVEFTAARYPELSSLAMAAEMSVGMAVWMRYRGHGWASTAEMCGAMFAPAVVLFPLLWTDVIAAGSMTLVEHLAMPPLMLLVMLRRRGEFTH